MLNNLDAFSVTSSIVEDILTEVNMIEWEKDVMARMRPYLIQDALKFVPVLTKFFPDHRYDDRHLETAE